MEITEVVLILIGVIICYKIYLDYIEKQNNENLEPIGNFIITPNRVEIENNKKKPLKNKKQKYSGKSMHKDVFKYFDKLDDFNEESKEQSIKTATLNPYFQEIQFHQDYRDTMNAFNLMCDQKNVFNKNFLPLLKNSHATLTEVTNIVDQFITTLNENIVKNVDDIAASKLLSWNDNMPPVTNDNDIINTKSSWEKYNKELGLPNSIYQQPAKREKVNLLKIDNIDKYETSDQLKYSIYLILQKPSSIDQMIVKVSFVIDKSDANLEREFFDKNKNSYETKIVIEEISIIGFLIKTGSGKPKTQRQKFYDYDGFSEGRLISEKDVIEQLNKKRKEIEENFVSNT